MKIVSWNIRGMNSVSKRAVIKEVVKSCKGEWLVFQETKMEVIDANIIRSVFPWSQCQFVMCPSTGASGGILIAWNEVNWQKQDEFVGRYSVSVFLKDVRHNTEWVASSVYGPYKYW